MSDATQNPPPAEEPRTPAPDDPAPQAAPPPPPASPAARPADLGERFLARLIDYVLLAVVNAFVVGFLIVGAIVGGNAGALGGYGASESYVAGLVSSLLGAAIALGYFALMESSRGQTVGKMVLKLETRGPDGGRPTMEQALRRNAFTALGVLGIIPLIGWILSPIASLVAVIMIAVGINNDTVRRQGWHDRFAGGTTVYKTG